jgi:hypothetical protein
MHKLFGLLFFGTLYLTSFGQIEIPSTTHYFYGYDNWFDLNDSVKVEVIEQKSSDIKKTEVIFNFQKLNIVEFKRTYNRLIKRDIIYNNYFYYDNIGRLIKCNYSGQFKKGKEPHSQPTILVTYDTINKSTVRLKAESYKGVSHYLEIKVNDSNTERIIKSLEIDSLGNVDYGSTLIITRYDSLGRVVYEKMTKIHSDSKYIDEYKIYYNDLFLPKSEDRYFYGKTETDEYENQYSVDYDYQLDEFGNWIKKTITNRMTGEKEVRKRKILYK